MFIEWLRNRRKVTGCFGTGSYMVTYTTQRKGKLDGVLYDTIFINEDPADWFIRKSKNNTSVKYAVINLQQINRKQFIQKTL